MVQARRCCLGGTSLPQQKSKPSNFRFSNNSGTDHHTAVIEHVSEDDPLEREEGKSDGFNDILSRVIDKTLRHVFGDINTGVIYKYLERKGCSPSDIPAKPNEFSAELRNILGSGRGQILGAASILEETIVETLSAELRIDLEYLRPAQFADNIEKLREAYRQKMI
jgi:hypothetical protein